MQFKPSFSIGAFFRWTMLICQHGLQVDWFLITFRWLLKTSCTEKSPQHRFGDSEMVVFTTGEAILSSCYVSYVVGTSIKTTNQQCEWEKYRSGIAWTRSCKDIWQVLACCFLTKLCRLSRFDLVDSGEERAKSRRVQGWIFCFTFYQEGWRKIESSRNLPPKNGLQLFRQKRVPFSIAWEWVVPGGPGSFNSTCLAACLFVVWETRHGLAKVVLIKTSDFFPKVSGT